MTKAFQHIRDRIRNIQFGVLRCKNEDGTKSWQVKASPAEDNLLYCVLDDETLSPEILDRDVNVIQKYKDDYLFITGRVAASVRNNKQVLSIQIAKACWFERRSRGAVSWLKEKYSYEHKGQVMPMALAIESE